MNKNQAKTITLGFGVFLLLGIFLFMFWMAAFPYDEVEHEREEIAAEKAEQRAKAIKKLQVEYMSEHH
ncbi:hypothetical protein [Cytobacillus gottheilii]|uniref:hypothetical protein n=1 Tax=Cytobacillus gottheilii TaxID=859144 RepID=UPI0009BB1058|nr:hypothetical protein [Cytobacillus gottheilii]